MIYMLQTEEILDGLAASTYGEDPHYSPYGEFSFEADSFDQAMAVATAYAQQEASSWSDSKIFVNLRSLSQVEHPCEFHFEVEELLK